MKKYSEFNEKKESNMTLSYYAFDWDDNLLYMDTKIRMEHLIDGEWVLEEVSTSKFAEIRSDSNNWRILPGENSFMNFRDDGPKKNKVFYEDSLDAINKKRFAPSWNVFIKCLIGGNIFMIVTARGHEPNTIRHVVEHIIYNILTDVQKDEMIKNLMKYHEEFDSDFDYLIDDYLDNCYFIGVASDSFKNKFGGGSTLKPEAGKELALKMFAKKANEYGKKINAKVNLGFSDDDFSTVSHVKKIFGGEFTLEYPIKYSLFHTKNGMSEINIDESRTPGLESSVLPFTKWNNMTQRLYPNGENPTDDYHNEFKNKVNSSIDLHKKFAYKRKLKD